MSKPQVMVMSPIWPAALEVLAARFDLLRAGLASDRDAFLQAAGKDCRAVILRGRVRLGPETEGLVGRDVLTHLGPKGTLINIARGSVADEAALIDCLAQCGALPAPRQRHRGTLRRDGAACRRQPDRAFRKQTASDAGRATCLTPAHTLNKLKGNPMSEHPLTSETRSLPGTVSVATLAIALFQAGPAQSGDPGRAPCGAQGPQHGRPGLHPARHAHPQRPQPAGRVSQPQTPAAPCD